MSILGSVFDPTVPGAELTAALAFLGAAEIAGITAGVVALRAKEPAQEAGPAS